MTDDDRPPVRDRLEQALANVEPDNPVAATRKVAGMARSYRPKTRSQWEAFRFAAVKTLRPYYEARDMDPAKAAAWAVVDPYYGRLDRGDGDVASRDAPDNSDSGRNSRALRVRQALTGGGAQ